MNSKSFWSFDDFINFISISVRCYIKQHSLAIIFVAWYTQWVMHGKSDRLLNLDLAWLSKSCILQFSKLFTANETFELFKSCKFAVLHLVQKTSISFSGMHPLQMQCPHD